MDFENIDVDLQPEWLSEHCSDIDLAKLKTLGNTSFKNKDYNKAILHYSAILHRTMHINRNSNIKIDAWNNIGLVYLKRQCYYQCIDKCNMVLKFDCKNEKATSRKRYCMQAIVDLEKSKQSPQPIATIATKTPNAKKRDQEDEKKHDHEDIKLPQQIVIQHPLADTSVCKRMGLPINNPLFDLRKVSVSNYPSGFGLFAKKFIKQGTIIYSERELFRLPRNVHNSIKISPKSYNNNIQPMIQISQQPQLLEIELNKLNKEKRLQFDTMVTSDINIEKSKININQFLTNNNIVNSDVYGIEKNAQKFGAIFNFASRINHSCKPNVHSWYNFDEKKFITVAVCDISENDQLFIKYLASIPQIRQERRDELLKLYGFICECSLCHEKMFSKYDDGDDHDGWMKEWIQLRRKLFDAMKKGPQYLSKEYLKVFNSNGKKGLDVFGVLERILEIFEKYLDSDAYLMHDYCEHGKICAYFSGANVKILTKCYCRYVYWYNVNRGCIVDTGNGNNYNGKVAIEYLPFQMPKCLNGKENEWKQLPRETKQAIFRTIKTRKL